MNTEKKHNAKCVLRRVLRKVLREAWLRLTLILHFHFLLCAFLVSDTFIVQFESVFGETCVTCESHCSHSVIRVPFGVVAPKEGKETCILSEKAWPQSANNFSIHYHQSWNDSPFSFRRSWKEGWRHPVMQAKYPAVSLTLSSRCSCYFSVIVIREPFRSRKPLFAWHVSRLRHQEEMDRLS